MKMSFDLTYSVKQFVKYVFNETLPKNNSAYSLACKKHKSVK